jgi:hypothetical protein
VVAQGEHQYFQNNHKILIWYQVEIHFPTPEIFDPTSNESQKTK